MNGEMPVVTGSARSPQKADVLARACAALTAGDDDAARPSSTPTTHRSSARTRNADALSLVLPGI